jgi:ABC-type transport system substrate-binding protein
MWRLVGNGFITLDEKKRLAMYKELQKILLTEALQVPLFSVSKFQVVRRRVKNMYVAFSDFNTGLKTAWVE